MQRPDASGVLTWSCGLKTVDPETVVSRHGAPTLGRSGNDSRKTFAYARNPPIDHLYVWFVSRPLREIPSALRNLGPQRSGVGGNNEPELAMSMAIIPLSRIVALI